MSDSPSDQELLHILISDPDQGIDLIFRKHYAFVCKAVYRIISDEHLTEDIAQEVFFELWKKRDRLQISTSLKAYLSRAGVNKALNHIRAQKMDFAQEPDGLLAKQGSTSITENMEAAELETLIQQSIAALPPRCRLVFSLSRFEQMSYQQIADQLEISIKTVENQISKALKLLHTAIGPYLKSLLLVLTVDVIFAAFLV